MAFPKFGKKQNKLTDSSSTIPSRIISVIPFVVRSCPTLCNSMDCSTPGFPVLHCLPEFAQTHVHQVGDAIQPSHPLSPPSLPALNLSQHQGFFKSYIGASSVQFSRSVMSDSLWPHELQHARPPCPSPTPGIYPNSCPLSQWCHPTISSCHPLLLLPSILPSIRVFSNESALSITWSKYWSFHFSISPSNEYSGLISFRMDWLDLLAAKGTLKSLLQHHSSKASILWCSAFFIVQLSHQYMTARKTIALTRWTFVGKVMPLLFNT